MRTERFTDTQIMQIVKQASIRLACASFRDFGDLLSAMSAA